MDKLTETTQNHKLGLWISRIKECRCSGMTVQQWCDQQHIGVKTYYYWMRKIKRQLLDASLPDLVKSPIEQPLPAEQQTVFSKIETFSEISIEQSTIKPAVTLKINQLSVDIHNGADQSTIDFTLQALKRFC